MPMGKNDEAVGSSTVSAVACSTAPCTRPSLDGLSGRGQAIRTACAIVAFVVVLAPGVHARQSELVELTLESAVELAMGQSYSVRQLQMGVDRTRSLLKAERAGLKTRVDLELMAPEFEAISDYEWNSDLGRNELVRENSRRWEANLSVQQPVILFGYPTDGYLSFNTQLYRHTELQDDEPFTSYYNRYFLAYEQPLFQPNELKYELRQAELELEEADLEFQESVIGLIDDIADDYYELFEVAYQRMIYGEHVGNLERAAALVEGMVLADSSRTIDASQIRVELANARERLEQMRSEFRVSASQMKQQLRLAENDSLVVRPVLDILPIDVNLETAIEYGMTLRPSLRELEIEREEYEAELDQTRGRDSFQLDLRLTYGREMIGPDLGSMWDEPRNSYTVSVNADVPLWDWGARNARIEAATISVRQTELALEETRAGIRTDITSAVQNLEAYRQRTSDMAENLEVAAQLTETSLSRYADDEVTTLELLRSLDRQAETAANVLDTYLGYRRALLDLQELTYYDFEHGTPVLDRFRVQAAPPQ